MGKQKSELILNPKKMVSFLGWMVIFFIFSHLIMHIFKDIFGNNLTNVVASFFNLDNENNAPTLFSLCLFMINSILFLLVWKAQQVKNKAQLIWIILSALFCLLALDEFVSFHENLVFPLRSAINASGIFYFAWIIPYGIMFLLLSIFFFPVFLKINKKVRFWFVLSTATFITGTIGLEMLEGWYLEMMSNQRDIIYFFLMTFEESFEMVGLVMLVYTLFLLLQIEYGGFVIRIPGAQVSISSNKPNDKISGKQG